MLEGGPLVKTQLIIVIILVGILTLSAVDLRIYPGIMWVNNKFEGDRPAWPNPMAEETLSYKSSRVNLGLGVRQNLTPYMDLDARLAYIPRDYSIGGSVLHCKGGYCDISLHPVINVMNTELYAGPSLAILLYEDHHGRYNGYFDGESENFSQFIPGLHAGFSYPSHSEGDIFIDFSYNRDLLPFSESINLDKFHEKYMLSMGYRFLNRNRDLSPFLSELSELPWEKREEIGIRCSDIRDIYILEAVAGLEYKRYYHSLGFGWDASVTSGMFGGDGTGG